MFILCDSKTDYMFSLHNNPPSQRNCKLLCHNNWVIIPDLTTIEHGCETDMKWTRLLSWKHLTDVHQNLVFEMGKNRWRARVTDNGCKKSWHGWRSLHFPCYSKNTCRTNQGYFTSTWTMWSSFTCTLTNHETPPGNLGYPNLQYLCLHWQYHCSLLDLW